MLSKPIRDCGCGGGNNCITKHKKQFRAWVRDEMKRLDCGCGCKGTKKFEQKYGKLVGGKLKDCPPGWRNDGLTCVENCRPDEFDDGLTCRKKCEPGFVDDGLTCRKPITSSIDPCPSGSTDVAGTCWGPVRQDCVDDCFKHPAPGCRTWECGRLRGAFNEDWGPKWCTDCNLRCGQTCWDVYGITKQLHERNLRLSGGEVLLQAIRGKTIQGRVDWDATIAEIQQGLQDVFSADSGLAKLFDPEKNGVAAALRKFGDDTKGAFEEVGRKTKDAFDKMGADAKAAFEKFARDAEGNLTNMLGKEFMDKMKDPKFWIEAAAIMAQVGASILGVLVTVGTLGVGAAAGAAIIMAANMAGPAIRMIGKAAMGEPIDALDIADMALSAIPAPGPGKAATSLIGKAAQAVIRNGATIKAIGGLVISGVKAGQALGVIPSSCIGPNCPPPAPPSGPPEPPEDYNQPPKPPLPPPPPPGQLSDEEIIALQPADTVNRKIDGPNGTRIDNPKYIPGVTWINQYRKEHYGTPTTDNAGNLVSPNDAKIQNIPSSVPQEPVEIPEGTTLEGDVIEPFSFDQEEEIVPFTFDGEGDQEGEQVNIQGESVPEQVPVPVEPPKVITKPIGQPLTDEEIIDLQPADTINRMITVDGKRVKNPKYIPSVTWIEQYKANLAKLPEEPQTTGELIAQKVEPIQAVEQSQAQAQDTEITPFEFGAEEEIVPFGAEEEVPQEEVVPFEFGAEEEAPQEEVLPFEFGAEEVSQAPAKPIKVGDQTIFPDQYLIEKPGDKCCGRAFQEDELIGGAEGDEIEPFIDGDVLSNPFGSLKTVKEYPYIPKTHRGNNFIVECYAAKNPEVAESLKNDPDKLTSHWIDIGSKKGFDADCGPGTSTTEERFAMLQEQERLRLQLEGKKTNCGATDRFWIEREGRCDGKRNAKGERKAEASACDEAGNYWDSDYGFQFCNKFLDVDGKPKSGKQFCNSKNYYWDGSACDDTRNLDGSPKLTSDLCADLKLEYTLPVMEDTMIFGKKGPQKVKTRGECNPEKDEEGKPINEEKLCLDSVSYFKDGKCDITRFPNGELKPPEYIQRNRIVTPNDLQTPIIPYDKKSLVDFYYAKRTKLQNNDSKNLITTNQRYQKEIDPIQREAVVDMAKNILKLYDAGYAVKTNRISKDVLTNPGRLQDAKLRWILSDYALGVEGTPGVKTTLSSDQRREFGDFLNAFNYYMKSDPKFINDVTSMSGKGKTASLTLYWADWCPHCHDMMPEWQKLGSSYKGIQIQALEQKQSGFKGPFPTIIFRNGNSMEKYEGPRTKTALVKFLKNKLA